MPKLNPILLSIDAFLPDNSATIAHILPAIQLIATLAKSARDTDNNAESGLTQADCDALLSDARDNVLYCYAVDLPASIATARSICGNPITDTITARHAINAAFDTYKKLASLPDSAYYNIPATVLAVCTLAIDSDDYATSQSIAYYIRNSLTSI